MLRFLVVLLIIFLPSQLLAQPIWIVDQGGGGDFTTVQACANTVTAGQTCEIVAATYSETVTLSTSGTAGNPITFRGQTATKPRITGEFLISDQDHITIENIELGDWIRCSPFGSGACNHIKIMNNAWEGPPGIGIQLWAFDVLISGNTFNNIINDIIRMHGERWTIRNNSVVSETDTMDEHLDFWQTLCAPNDVTGTAASHALIENNLFEDVSGANVHFAVANANGPCSDPATNIIFRYNRIKDIGSKAIP